MENMFFMAEAEKTCSDAHVPPPPVSESPDSTTYSDSNSAFCSGFNAEPSGGFCYGSGGGGGHKLYRSFRPSTAKRHSSVSRGHRRSPSPEINIPKPPTTATTNHVFTFSSKNSPQEKTSNPVTHLQVMVEKKSRRVVLAECNKDFMDLLFSFLTLPIGSILKIFKESSPLPPTSIGCMNNIRISVENLDARFFVTEACREMLLSPRRSSQAELKNLKFKIVGSLEPTDCFYYFCQNSICRREGTVGLSAYSNVHCHCGQVMSQFAKEKTISEAHGDTEGVFVKGVMDMFSMTDDLQVMQGSSSLSIASLKKLGINDANALETQIVTIQSEEVLQLLELALVSRAPLTDLIRLKQADSDMEELHVENISTAKSPDKRSKTKESKRISLKVFRSISKNKVLYAECGEDFLDFLFSFLVFPLGSIVQLLDGNSSLLGIDNLYRSAKDPDMEDHFKSEELKNMLIKPKLAPFHACENQLLDVEETPFPLYKLHYLDSKTEWSVCPVVNTISEGSPSHLGNELGQFKVANPKYSNGETSSGGGYVKGPAKFMVTDSLVVTPLSAISCISFLAKLNVPISDVHATVVRVGKEEGLDLLRAALVSETPLSNVFN